MGMERAPVHTFGRRSWLDGFLKQRSESGDLCRLTLILGQGRLDCVLAGGVIETHPIGMDLSGLESGEAEFLYVSSGAWGKEVMLRVFIRKREPTYDWSVQTTRSLIERWPGFRIETYVREDCYFDEVGFPPRYPFAPQVDEILTDLTKLRDRVTLRLSPGLTQTVKSVSTVR